jgi:hypothetical protein
MLMSKAGPAIRQYQIVQARPDLVQVRIVPDARRSLDMPALERAAGEMLGPSVRCELRLEREIPSEATGKYRIYKSMDETSPVPDGPGG